VDCAAVQGRIAQYSSWSSKAKSLKGNVGYPIVLVDFYGLDALSVALYCLLVSSLPQYGTKSTSPT
jgi:hypothetical protein